MLGDKAFCEKYLKNGLKFDILKQIVYNITDTLIKYVGSFKLNILDMSLSLVGKFLSIVCIV